MAQRRPSPRAPDGPCATDSAAKEPRRAHTPSEPASRLQTAARLRRVMVPLSRLLDDCLQDRCLARLGPGVRREALLAAAHRLMVWLSSGLHSVGHRDEAWLERGLPSS